MKITQALKNDGTGCAIVATVGERARRMEPLIDKLSETLRTWGYSRVFGRPRRFSPTAVSSRSEEAQEIRDCQTHSGRKVACSSIETFLEQAISSEGRKDRQPHVFLSTFNEGQQVDFKIFGGHHPGDILDIWGEEGGSRPQSSFCVLRTDWFTSTLGSPKDSNGSNGAASKPEGSIPSTRTDTTHWRC